MKARFNQYFWSSGSNAYVFGLLNGVQSRTIDDRSITWAILADTADASRLPGVQQELKTKVNASPYQERFIEEAMFQAGSDTARVSSRHVRSAGRAGSPRPAWADSEGGW